MYAIRSYYDREPKRSGTSCFRSTKTGEQRSSWILIFCLKLPRYAPILVVITSYSIHYTKLYENGSCNSNVIASLHKSHTSPVFLKNMTRDLSLLLSSTRPRITSYNVCYTKLLRVCLCNISSTFTYSAMILSSVILFICTFLIFFFFMPAKV